MWQSRIKTCRIDQWIYRKTHEIEIQKRVNENEKRVVQIIIDDNKNYFKKE